MMNFDMPMIRKDDGPKLNPNGTVEFVPATDEEKAKLKEAKVAGIVKNIETGGSGKILSSGEKAGRWYGDPVSDIDPSEWAPDLERSVVKSVKTTTTETSEEEKPSARLSRQIEGIAKKRADVLAELVQATDDDEKKRLRTLADALEKGHSVKMREYLDMTDASQEINDDKGNNQLAA